MSTALEIENDDDNIERIHERKSLLSEGRKKVKSPSCKVMLGKAFLLSIAGILFILMMIELWGDYGNVINAQTLFKPRIHSIMESCTPGTKDSPQLTKSYNALACSWEFNKTGSYMHCNGNMPTHAIDLMKNISLL